MQSKSIDQLVQQFAKLPGMHNRQAKKVVAYFLNELSSNKLNTQNLVKNLSEIKNTARTCARCFNVVIKDEECFVCKKDRKYQPNMICVVESLYDLWRMSDISCMDYSFHVLGGIISAADNISPEMLNIDSLVQRIEEESITEIIIALNKSYNSLFTISYINEVLRKKFPSLTISTLAGGLPIGTEFDFIDDSTLRIAINSRIKC
jgi:recombination protein RecR